MFAYSWVDAPCGSVSLSIVHFLWQLLGMLKRLHSQLGESNRAVCGIKGRAAQSELLRMVHRCSAAPLIGQCWCHFVSRAGYCILLVNKPHVGVVSGYIVFTVLDHHWSGLEGNFCPEVLCLCLTFRRERNPLLVFCSFEDDMHTTQKQVTGSHAVVERTCSPAAHGYCPLFLSNRLALALVKHENRKGRGNGFGPYKGRPKIALFHSWQQIQPEEEEASFSIVPTAHVNCQQFFIFLKSASCFPLWTLQPPVPPVQDLQRTFPIFSHNLPHRKRSALL